MPLATGWWAVKLGAAAPAPVGLNSTESAAEPWLATARSSRPSPLTSAVVTPFGLVPAAELAAAAKVGVAAPGAVMFSSTETLLELRLATARSSRPSPLTSATVTLYGLVPAPKFTAAAKV